MKDVAALNEDDLRVEIELCANHRNLCDLPFQIIEI
jgi:hypothetical protein